MPNIIHCPSGLTGSIRGLKVREERVLADRKLQKAGSIVDELLRACWEETHDAGPYDFESGKVDWDKVLQGDRFFALLEIRALTYGAEYGFAVTCREDGCRARIDREFDLQKLPVRALSEESRAAFVGGNRFETVLPDAGKRVWFRLFTGADEGKLPALRKNAGERMRSAMLAFRVVEVEGVEDRERRRFVEELSMRIATQFSPTEATVGLKELAQAGFNAQESMKLLIPVLDLVGGSLGELSPAQAAGVASQALKAFRFSADDAAIAVDRMLQAVNVFALNASELPMALGNASRGAQALHQSMSETLIALGLVKNIIPGVERASTGVAVAMERMADPKVQRALRGVGVSVTDSGAHFRNFLDVLGELSPALSKMTDAKRSAFLIDTFGAHALGSVQAIMTQVTNGIRTNTGVTVKGADAIAYLRQQFENATVALVLEPLDLCARIAALIPPPRFHMIRYHDVLSSHAKLRSEVVPKVDDKGPKQLALFEHDRTVLAPEPRKKPWAWLLRHIFNCASLRRTSLYSVQLAGLRTVRFQLDVVTCVRCGGTTRLLEAATTPEAIAKLLAKHGLGPRPPPPRAAPTGQLRLALSTA